MLRMTQALQFRITNFYVMSKRNCIYKRFSNVCNKRCEIISKMKGEQHRRDALQRCLPYSKKSEHMQQQHAQSLTKSVRGILVTFWINLKGFYRDIKKFIAIRKKLKVNHYQLEQLPLKEIVLYDEMPRNMLKMLPAIIVFCTPIICYVALPVMVIFFPKQCLSEHFWNNKQKAKFIREQLHTRLLQNQYLLKQLKVRLESLQSHPLHNQWLRIINRIERGNQPTADEILSCKEYFSGKPYHLSFLKSKHMKSLAKLHNLYTGPYLLSRLEKKAFILHEMDLVIEKETIQNLEVYDLQKACLIRGLNPFNLSVNELAQWLKIWVNISNKAGKEFHSLLLHCPTLIGYNHPNNRKLITEKRKL